MIMNYARAQLCRKVIQDTLDASILRESNEMKASRILQVEKQYVDWNRGNVAILIVGSCTVSSQAAGNRGAARVLSACLATRCLVN